MDGPAVYRRVFQTNEYEFELHFIGKSITGIKSAEANITEIRDNLNLLSLSMLIKKQIDIKSGKFVVLFFV